LQHLTAIDAGFLQMETSQTPMHLASVHMLQLPDGFQGDFPEVFKRHIQSRLHLAPMLTRKLVSMPLDLASRFGCTTMRSTSTTTCVACRYPRRARVNS
jgi:diacylglycerol O-acyltransferase